MAAVYVPRSPTTGVLYGIVRTHLTEFLAAVDAQTDGRVYELDQSRVKPVEDEWALLRLPTGVGGMA